MAETAAMCQKDALIGQGFTGSNNDMLLQWAEFNGAITAQVNLSIIQALLSKGGTKAQFNEAWIEIWTSMGLVGNYNEMERAFWCDSGGLLPLQSVQGDFMNGIFNIFKKK